MNGLLAVLGEVACAFGLHRWIAVTHEPEHGGALTPIWFVYSKICRRCGLKRTDWDRIVREERAVNIREAELVARLHQQAKK